MTVKEAILILNANAVIACERAGFSSATVKMIEDALETIEDALKTQEPRVLTLEEVLSLQCDTPIYIENSNGYNGWDVYAGTTKDGESEIVTGAIWSTCEYWSQDEYGNTWRCWSARPTEEQREARPWEEG